MPARYRFLLRFFPLALAVTLSTNASAASTSSHADHKILPVPPAPFTGEIGRDIEHSKPAFPTKIKAPDNAPNILLVLTDDVGFSAASTFGGAVPTSNLDRLAANGLKYNNFHTTAMCSPTRASLLTGRNHHAVSTGTIINLATGYPGYWSVIPKSAATIAQILRYNGYSTAFFGKHHNVPTTQQSGDAGPFDLWPSGLGFEYFYGFVDGEVDQWKPILYRGTARVDLSHKDHDYILDRDLADDMIRWMHNQQAAVPNKPFLLYYAPGTAHAPHQAPKDWIEKFRGKFDQGWDKVREETFARQKAMGIIPSDAVLTPRPDGMPAWDSLSEDQKRVNARLMEVFAAMLAYQDAQFGRVIDELQRMNQLDNTLVIFVEGDNGASGEGRRDGMVNSISMQINQAQEDIGWKLEMLDEMGGPNTHAIFPAGWGWATNTPFRWMKQVASHLGGMRNGLVISWPHHITQTGEIRTQFSHVNDIMPTILEAIGIPQPEMVDGVKQQRVDGTSMLYTFDHADAPARHRTQYFEMLGNRGIYHDGWMANTTPVRNPWDFTTSTPRKTTDYDWELYDLRHDFSQSNDLAKSNPQKLAEMKEIWEKEARRNNVFPIDDRFQSRIASDRKSVLAKETSYLYWGPDISLPTGLGPSLAGRSFSLTAQIEVPESHAHGVIAAVGNKFAGWSFFLRDGKPVIHHAFTQQRQDQFRIASPVRLPAGASELRYDFVYDGGGIGKGGTMHISIDGKEVAQGRIERTYVVPNVTETFDTGQDTGELVVEDYRDENRFSGNILKIEVKQSAITEAKK